MGEEWAELSVVEGGAETICGHAAPDGAVLSERVEGGVAEDGEVLRGMIGADAAEVLVEGEVETPLQANLDAPVAAADAGEGAGIGRQAPQRAR